CFFLDPDPPQVHTAASITGEIEIPAIWRPDGIPIHVTVNGDRNRIPAVRGHSPDIALRTMLSAPIGDAVTIRRPAGLACIVNATRNGAALTGGKIHPEKSSVEAGVCFFDPAKPSGRTDNLLAVGRPARVVTKLCKAPDVFARCTHEKDSP